jgi:hypothetical protein
VDRHSNDTVSLANEGNRAVALLRLARDNVVVV